jgi:hypothetical protein
MKASAAAGAYVSFGMKTTQAQIEARQKTICERYRAAFVPAPSGSTSGFAQSTKGRIPVNGLRHPLVENTTGWYIWCGEYSDEPDFFSPLHTEHVYDEHPEIGEYLGLAPGFRFLLAENYIDVWFDSSLLQIEQSKGVGNAP